MAPKRKAKPQTGGVVTEKIRAAFADWQAVLEVPEVTVLQVADAFIVFRDLVYGQPGLSLAGTIQQLEEECGKAVLFPQYGKEPGP